VSATQPAVSIDVRTIVPRDRHPLIFSSFGRLAVGETLELVNDHDPKPLFYQFSAEMPGQFDWEYLEQGPEVFRVAISRVKTGKASEGSCCGSCGGGH
jgi:uncharacterized protein (DUF2249 family)